VRVASKEDAARKVKAAWRSRVRQLLT